MLTILRWTRCDVFIHINSFTKNRQKSELLYRKLHSRKFHIWSIIFHIWNFIHEKMSHLVHHFLHMWNFIHENVTPGPSFFIYETSFTKKSHLVHHVSYMKLHLFHQIISHVKFHTWNLYSSFCSIFMCEASHMKFDLVCHQILQVYMYENVTSGPSHHMANCLFVIKPIAKHAKAKNTCTCV